MTADMDDAHRRLEKFPLQTGRTGEVRWLRDRAGSRLFAVRGLGLREGMPPCHVLRPRGTPDHLFMHFHDECELDVGDGMRPIAAGTCVLWRPDRMHHYGRLGARWTHSWIHCAGSAVGETIARLRLPTEEPLVGPDGETIDQLWRLLIRECTAFQHADAEILAELFAVLALQVRRSAAATPAEAPTAIAEARALIDRRYAEPLAIAGIAARAKLSPSRFAAEFRRWYGTTPRAYLIDVRMRHASHHLRDAHRTVADVARAVGIDDAFYFSRLFRQRHGLSPEAFRRAAARPRRA